MADFDILAKYYDAFYPDPSTKVLWLQEQITKYHTKPQSLLELACGTGELLKHFRSYASYSLTGLDQSSGMLKVAKQKLPKANFVQGDMSDFTLDQRFDVIICMLDSINNLLRFAQWESLFKHVAKHLNKNGLFIFDMNTIKKLTELEPIHSYVKKLGSAHIELTHRIDGPTPEIHIKIYKNGTLIGEEHILEVSFEVNRVEQALKKYFRILERTEPNGAHPPYDKERIYFFCQKLK